MKETGIAVAVQEGRVIVSVKRTDACRGCTRCSHARISFGRDDSLTVEAVPVGPVKPGDLVELEMPADDFLRAVSVVYIMPVLSLGVGYGTGLLLGSRIGSGGLWGVIGAGAGLFLWYIWLRGYDTASRTSGRYLPLARAISEDEPW